MLWYHIEILIINFIWQNPVGDQPDDIEIQIKEMILKYITPENAVILAVSPANQDISTSEAIQMAQKLDPKGTIILWSPFLLFIWLCICR